MRITAHMIRVDSGYDVWSQTYDRELKDIFQVQNEIAVAVVQALKAQLLPNRSEAYRPANMEAYTLFLQGRYLNAQDSGPSWRRAAHLLQRAVGLDPDYAVAWAALARAHYYLAAVVDRGPGRDSDMDAAGAAIQKALALNPSDAATHYLLALIKVTYEHDWKGAVAEMDAGRRADPELTEPRELVGVVGCASGPCQQKYMHDISRDIEHDPLNVQALTDRAWSHAYAGELEAAESDMRRAHELNPGSAAHDLAIVLIARGKAAEALPLVEAQPDSWDRREDLALVYQALGRKAEADAALRELLDKDSNDAPFELAEVFAARGDTKSALDWLQRDYDLKLYGIIDAKVDLLLKPLANEPRFIALMNKFAPSQ